MKLDQDFWNNRYINKQTGWDLGEVSPPLKEYIDKIADKNTKILIPGAGNAYELSYLIDRGFTNVTIIDIAPRLIEQLKSKYDEKDANIIQGDFFEHEGDYELILEQTFFCALDPSLRKAYVKKMSNLLITNGKLCGVLFDRDFEGGPPFGGNKMEYERLFKDKFKVEHLERCYNSHPARQGSEVWIELIRK